MTIEERKKDLKAWLKKGNYTVFCNLKHVSKSGMSRDIQFFTIVNNEPCYLTYSIAEVLGYKMKDNEGLRVGGCGMDMGFHVVNSLSIALYCNGTYTHEGAYKLKSRWI
jgi:hypothetical protein